jgi:two-component system LytT family response regulator
MFETIDFRVIFVTAYSEYAIKAFRVNAVDYLLKPIKIDELKDAIEKIK